MCLLAGAGAPDWSLGPRRVCLPSNIARVGGERDAEDCDPYAPHSVYRLLRDRGFDEALEASMPYDERAVRAGTFLAKHMTLSVLTWR